MNRSVATELEFDKILKLVAAYARTDVGRSFVEGLAAPIDDDGDGSSAARLSHAVHELIEEDEAFALAGVDDAVPWLEPDAPPPSEPRDLVSLLTLARRVAAVRRRLAAGKNDLLQELANRLPDTRSRAGLWLEARTVSSDLTAYPSLRDTSALGLSVLADTSRARTLPGRRRRGTSSDSMGAMWRRTRSRAASRPMSCFPSFTFDLYPFTSQDPGICG